MTNHLVGPVVWIALDPSGVGLNRIENKSRIEEEMDDEQTAFHCITTFPGNTRKESRALARSSSVSVQDQL